MGAKLEWTGDVLWCRTGYSEVREAEVRPCPAGHEYVTYTFGRSVSRPFATKAEAKRACAAAVRNLATEAGVEGLQ
jgi:hypothetical protein